MENPRLAILCLPLLLTACAYSQKMTLTEPGAQLLNPAGIVINDVRGQPERKTDVQSRPCARSYGDKFITPDKVSYLKHLLASEQSTQPLELTLKRFDTIEYCEKSAAETAAAGAGASMGLLGYFVLLPLPEMVKNPGKDLFLVRVAGEINGKPFDLAGSFDYADVAFLNFPSESPVYRTRVDKSLHEIAHSLVVYANGENGTKP